MADIQNECPDAVNGFKEAVCIDAGRVFDSCCDRDCVADLRCYFTEQAQTYVDKAISVRLKKAEVLNVSIHVEPVSFNRGYYSCDLTFFFLLDLDLYLAPHSCPTPVQGIAIFNKKVILFGSDGNVKSFSNITADEAENCDTPVTKSTNMPRCVVKCVDPIALSACIGHTRGNYDSPAFIPKSVTDYIGGNLVTNCPSGSPAVFVTIGLFTIIQLIRNVQMLIPVYDYCIPEKQCDDSTDQPCDVFRRIKFPTDDFFPPNPNDIGDGPGCGCGISQD